MLRQVCRASVCVGGSAGLLSAKKESNSSSRRGTLCEGGSAEAPVPGLNGRRRLLMGIPKKGRLYERITVMLKGAGIEYSRQERLDIAECKNLPLTVVFLPAADIAKYVGEGEVDIGITGEDIVAESDVNVDVLVKLGLGKCRLSLQGPKGKYTGSPESLAGKRIATSFPFLTHTYFTEIDAVKGPLTKIKVISGSVEAAVGLGLADAVVDLVETIRKRIIGHVTADGYLMVAYNVPRKNLQQCKIITPGKNSPTVSPLDRRDWCAVSALVPKKNAAKILDDLEVIIFSVVFFFRTFSSGLRRPRHPPLPPRLLPHGRLTLFFSNTHSHHKATDSLNGSSSSTSSVI